MKVAVTLLVVLCVFTWSVDAKWKQWKNKAFQTQILSGEEESSANNCAKVCSGTTGRGVTDYQDYDDGDNVYVDVDMSGCQITSELLPAMSYLLLRLAALAVLMTLGSTQSGCSLDRCLNDGGSTSVTLRVGESLTSTNGRVKAIMQSDGNLVIYCVQTYPWKVVWASNTDGDHIVNGAVFQSDGNLVLYDYKGRVRFAANCHHRGGARLIMQNDANMVIYTNYGRAVWDTRTSGHCG
ncbi:hypothetical protein ACHWQZ_G018205 [Mnemiopsis leidyi]